MKTFEKLKEERNNIENIISSFLPNFKKNFNEDYINKILEEEIEKMKDVSINDNVNQPYDYVNGEILTLNNTKNNKKLILI